MDPRVAEMKGMPYMDYRKLADLASETGYVDPYVAEDHGVEFSSWRLWEDDRRARE